MKQKLFYELERSNQKILLYIWQGNEKDGKIGTLTFQDSKSGREAAKVFLSALDYGANAKCEYSFLNEKGMCRTCWKNIDKGEQHEYDCDWDDIPF